MRCDQLQAEGLNGFTLVELMLAALVGALLCGVAFQLLVAETLQGGLLALRFG